MELRECTNSEYHGEKEHLSSSNYKLLLEDLQKFYNEKILGIKKVEEEKAHYQDGSYLHSLILEPEQVEKEYAFFTGIKKQGKAFEEFKEVNKGKTILGVNQKKRVDGWFETYKKCTVATELIKGGSPELSLFGELKGIKTKVRADYINSDEGYIVDVKTTSFGLEVEDFKNTMSSFHYELSAALYSEMFEAYFGKPFQFYFLVVGKEIAGCKVFRLGEKSRSKGQMQLNEARKIYKNCLLTNNWHNAKIEAEISDEIEEV